MNLDIIETGGLFRVVDQDGRELAAANNRDTAELLWDVCARKVELFWSGYRDDARTLYQMHRALSARGWRYADPEALRADLVKFGWRVRDVTTADGRFVRCTNIYPPAPTSRPAGRPADWIF